MSIHVLRATLARLGFDRPGEVFWLTTSPAISDDELVGSLLVTAGRDRTGADLVTT